MLQSITAAFLVTKDGGAPGGFEEKAAGAKQAGAKLVVIGRPPEADAGLSLEETISTLCSRFGFPLTPEVFLAGIGPGASAFSSPPSARQFKNPTVSSARSAWLDAVARPGQQTCDAIAPGEHRFGGPRASRMPDLYRRSLRRHRLFQRREEASSAAVRLQVTVLPGISSMSYLCAKLGCKLRRCGNRQPARKEPRRPLPAPCAPTGRSSPWSEDLTACRRCARGWLTPAFRRCTSASASG